MLKIRKKLIFESAFIFSLSLGAVVYSTTSNISGKGVPIDWSLRFIIPFLSLLVFTAISNIIANASFFVRSLLTQLFLAFSPSIVIFPYLFWSSGDVNEVIPLLVTSLVAPLYWSTAPYIITGVFPIVLIPAIFDFFVRCVKAYRS